MLTDKAFSRLVITSILAIFICIACLCSSTFAWFTKSNESVGNEIKSADGCELSIVVTKDAAVLQNIENGVELSAGEEYVVTLSLPAGTSSGYCMITVDDDPYYSEYILRHEEGTKTISFKVISQTTQTVKFTSRWGIFTRDCDVANNGTLIIP